ncbi:response regulator transcription factor [Streptomyces sanglieri]
MHTTDTPPPVPAAGEPPAHPGRQACPAPGTNNPDVPARGHVLVVDDDPTVAEVVTEYLTRAGYEVARVADGPAALEQYAAHRPDLAVLDLMLPGMDGFEVCRRMREHGPVPVIMLTARGDEDDRILGLETGADDYVTKPFSLRELVLRVDSVLRRARTATPSGRSELLQGAGLVLDLAARRATWEGRVLALTLREFDLLAFLLRHPGRVFTREELMRGVWGWDFGDLSTVTVHVRRLRGKVEADPARPELIRTVWGVGYRLDAPPDPATGTAASTPATGTAASATATGTDSDSGSGTPS